MCLAQAYDIMPTSEKYLISAVVQVSGICIYYFMENDIYFSIENLICACFNVKYM